MPVLGRGGGAEELGEDGLRLVVNAALDPDLFHGLAPATERAYGVAARENRIEVLEQRVPPQPLEHPLAHFVGRLDVERDPDEGPDRAETYHEALELGVPPLLRQGVAVRSEDLEPGDGRCQIAVVVARAMRSSADRAGHRDVRQRCQVREGQALLPEPLYDLAVSHRPTH